MATIVEIMDALAARLYTALSSEFENLSVTGRLVANPSPPHIDIYPGDPFFERSGMGRKFDYYFTVRARVLTADLLGGQDQLLSIMDPDAATSLTEAIEGTYAISGTTYDVSVEEGPSAYGIFNDPGDVTNRLLGALWRIRVLS